MSAGWWIPDLLTGGAAVAAAGLFYAVRYPGASWLAPSITSGSKRRKAIAITFDDGPSESTPDLLQLLEAHQARCTFFQCGYHVERLPDIAKQVLAAGHEIGNHTYSHAALYFRPAQFIADEIYLAQEAISRVCGVVPKFFRPPYGARWFGLRRALTHFELKCVMWSGLGLDWKLNAEGIYQRLRKCIRPGAIFCLHDGRELAERPDIRPTIEAVRRLLPELREQGFELIPVSDLLCQTTSPSA
ncbi:MAG: polysaccharide deacetylase family protein [Bryobacteraceae bacterium]|nr:polysaccharide deacetylase family protein [Bryobacteraceae bacterium]MDW8377400.1 polysaccharide deacetylase family protein [Bryobacterales bacterium]